MQSVIPTLKTLIRTLNYNQCMDIKKYLLAMIDNDYFDLMSIRQLVRHFHPIVHCICCQGTDIVKHGPYKEGNRYKCKITGKTFNDLTGTVFHYLHDHEAIKQYIKEFLNKLTLREICKRVQIYLPKAFYWRHKITYALQAGNIAPLKGVIQVDATYFQKSFKGIPQLQITLNRLPRKRGTDSGVRGISHEKIPVLTAIDSSNSIVTTIAGIGKLTQDMVAPILNERIPCSNPDNQSVFVSDGDKAFLPFVKEKNLIHKIIPSTSLKKATTDGYNLQTINQIHSDIKGWMRSFKGVATKYLQNYLNYWYFNKTTKDFKDQLFELFKVLTMPSDNFVSYLDIDNRYNYA